MGTLYETCPECGGRGWLRGPGPIRGTTITDECTACRPIRAVATGYTTETLDRFLRSRIEAVRAESRAAEDRRARDRHGAKRRTVRYLNSEERP